MAIIHFIKIRGPRSARFTKTIVPSKNFDFLFVRFNKTSAPGYKLPTHSDPLSSSAKIHVLLTAKSENKSNTSVNDTSVVWFSKKLIQTPKLISIGYDSFHVSDRAVVAPTTRALNNHEQYPTFVIDKNKLRCEKKKH